MRVTVRCLLDISAVHCTPVRQPLLTILTRFVSQMASMLALALAVTLSFFVTIASVGILKRIAPWLGLLDHPGGRKQHEISTPVVGGLAMGIGLFAAWLLVPGVRPPTAWMGGVLLFFVLGAIDDRAHLRAGPKFLFQAFISAAVVVGSEVSLHALGEIIPGWAPDLGWLAVPFSVFAIVSVMNAINMSDGVDGLAGSLCLVALLVLGGVAWLSGNAHVIELSGVLGACLAAFLIFNLRGWSGRPARIFMGDAGSLGVGFLIAIIALQLCSLSTARGGAPPAVVVWACFVPLADGLSVIAARLLRGQGATAPGRDHLHHLLLARGMTPAQVVAIEAGGGLGLAVLAIAAWQLGAPEWLLVLGFVALLSLFYAGVSSQWSRLRRTHGRAVDESGLPDEVDIATDRVAG